MQEKYSGIVLGGVSFGESDKILNVFTLEKGVISAKIKGVKKAGAKLKFAAEPFCFAEFIFSKSQEKRTVIGASLIDSFYPIRTDLKRYYAGATVLEFVKRFYRESTVDEQEFFCVINALKNIAYGDNPITQLIAFLIDSLKTVGFSLTVTNCFGCGCEIEGRVFFDYRSGAFLCEACREDFAREINPLTLETLKKAQKGSLNDGEEGVVKALKLMEYYIANRTEENLSCLSELIKILN
jgi:DNA repair protein RecO (recombination protein O)